MAHLLLLARSFPRTVNVTKTAIIQDLMVYAREKFERNETKCDKTEQLLSQAQQMSQSLARKPTSYEKSLLLLTCEILPENDKIFKNYKLQATNYKQITNHNVRNYKQPYRAR
jgi:hypothetical protein